MLRTNLSRQKMKYLFSFSGRSERFEWWVISIITDLAAQLCLIFGFLSLHSDASLRYLQAGGLFLCVIASLWMSIAVSVRRMRDRERSPWLLLAGLVPVVGWIWYFIECGFLPAPGKRGPRGPRKLVRRMVTANAEQGVTPNA
jgi:uncharacterized membrane protein YhaH (DUF805 family)